MAANQSIEEILDAIGDKQARTVLATISREPQSVKELANTLECSLATIYRRIELLEENDLVTHKTIVADDGNHYKMYDCNFDSTVISLDGDEYDVRIFRRENLPDRFTQLWDELSGEDC